MELRDPFYCSLPTLVTVIYLASGLRRPTSVPGPYLPYDLFPYHNVITILTRLAQVRLHALILRVAYPLCYKLSGQVR